MTEQSESNNRRNNSNNSNNNKAMQKQVKEKVRVTCKKYLQYEIDDLKDHLRQTYSIEAKKSMGYEPTEDETKLIEEKAVNNALVEKLQKMLNNFDANEKRHSLVQEISQNVTLLQFFYLVRLAQQGFFQLVAGIYPNVEPQALTYLCDKLVGASLHATRAEDPEEQRKHKRLIHKLVSKIKHGDPDPIADGFVTTYKHLRQAIDGLADQSLQKDNNAEQTEEQKLSQNSNTSQQQQQQQQPIWIVMPYTSMMDGVSFGMPGLINSLSGQLPSSFPQSSLIPPHAVTVGKSSTENYAHSNSGNEMDENDLENEEINHKNTIDNNIPKKNEGEEEKVEVEDKASEETPEMEVKNVDDSTQKTEDIPIIIQTDTTVVYNDMEDDRFADPDMDDIAEIPIQPSPLDSFMDSSAQDNSDSLVDNLVPDNNSNDNVQDNLAVDNVDNIVKEETKTPDSPISTDSKSKWNDSFSNAVKEEGTRTPDSPRSIDSKPKINNEETASPDWKNFRPTDQANRNKKTQQSKNNHQNKRRNQPFHKDNRRKGSPNEDNNY